MDESEILRILVIIEKLQKGRGLKSQKLEKIYKELKDGLDLSEEDRNFVLGMWEESNKLTVTKHKSKPKPLHKNPMFVILTSILVFGMLIGISLGQTTPSEPKINQINIDQITLETKNSFLEKFRKLDNKGEIVLLEFAFEEVKDNKPWEAYHVIRVQPETIYGDYFDPACYKLEKELEKEWEKANEEEGNVLLALLLSDYSEKSKAFHEQCPKEIISENTIRTTVGTLAISIPNGYIENISFQIIHNFDNDVMGIAMLLFEEIGKEYIYSWSDVACLDAKYDDKCLPDDYNNKYLHFLNGGSDGLTWKKRTGTESGVVILVEREFKEFFTAHFFIGNR